MGTRTRWFALTLLAAALCGLVAVAGVQAQYPRVESRLAAQTVAAFPAPGLTLVAAVPWDLSLPIGLAAALMSLIMTTAGILGWNRVLKARVNERNWALSRLAQRHRDLIENANDAIVTVAPSDGAILEANRKMERLTGHPRQHLLCSRLESLLPERERQNAGRRLDDVLLNGAGSFDDWVVLRKDGSRVSVEVSASVVELGRRKVLQMIIRDVTERKSLQAELVRRNRNLSALNAIAATLARSHDQDEILDATLGKIVDVTGAFAAALYLADGPTGGMTLRAYRGHPPVLTVQARSMWEGGNASHRAALLEGHRAQAAAAAWWPDVPRSQMGAFVSLQLAVKDKQLGTLIVVGPQRRGFTQEDLELLTAACNQTSVAIENAGLFNDLRTAVGDLFMVKQFNDNILESMSNGLLTVDLSGRITMLNLAAERTLGYARDEAIGKPLKQVVVSRNGLDHILSDTLRTGLSSPRTETSVVRKSGEQVPVDVSASVLRDGSGAATGLLVVFTDLSGIRRMEEERRQLDRLAALGQMSAVVAHEVRNPLAAISAGAQYVASSDLTEDQRETIDIILGEIDRMDRMVDDILMFSKPPALQLIPRSVPDIVNRVLDRESDRAEECGVHITRVYTPDLPLSPADSSRLDRAISNLVANAIDAMADGGDLRVTVRLKPSSDMTLAPSIEIEVADTGEGIADDKLPRIFEPYFSTKAKGTGLGLAITKSIVQEHGGKIEVQSKRGVGTVVNVCLPAVDEETGHEC